MATAPAAWAMRAFCVKLQPPRFTYTTLPRTCAVATHPRPPRKACPSRKTPCAARDCARPSRARTLESPRRLAQPPPHVRQASRGRGRA